MICYLFKGIRLNRIEIYKDVVYNKFDEFKREKDRKKQEANVKISNFPFNLICLAKEHSQPKKRKKEKMLDLKKIKQTEKKLLWVFRNKVNQFSDARRI